MADTIEDAIRNSVADAEDGIIGTPEPEGTEAPAPEPVEVSPSAEVVPEPVAAVAAPTDDWALKVLEDAGIKPPKKGRENSRENNLPWGRFQPILNNVRKKFTADHAAALKERDDKLTAAEAKVKSADFFDNLIATNPDGLMRELARIHPTLYSKYQQPNPTAPALSPAAAPIAPGLSAKPEPDAKFPDGSLGYSPEQHAKLMEWHEAKAEAAAVSKVTALMDARYGPLEKQYKAQQVHNQNRPVVLAQIAEMRKVWGKLFDEGAENEVAAYMKANPGTSLASACATVLVPKTAAQRDTMRAELIREMKARPAAAARTTGNTPAPVVEDADGDNDPVSAAIRKSIQGMR